MDFWQYPAGTKLFKEFSVNGVRIETRLVYKRGDNDLFYMAFQWNNAPVYGQDVAMDLWLQTAHGQLSTVQTTAAYMTRVSHQATTMLSGVQWRIAPGQPAMSEVHVLMNLRSGASEVDGSVGVRCLPRL